MRYATGPRKNILLTLWLSLPILIVASLVAGIFYAYHAGPIMQARPVGQGAGDTGGANALGEWLAGHDVIKDEKTRRDLREGRLIDPLAWPGGIVLRIECPQPCDRESWVYLWRGAGSDDPRWVMRSGVMPRETSRFPDTHGVRFVFRSSVSIDASEIIEMFGEGRPGAGIYISPTAGVTPQGSVLIDADGNRLERVEIPLVPRDRAEEGEPIEITVTIGRE